MSTCTDPTTPTATPAPGASAFHEWLAVMPDLPDALPRRLAVREAHLARIAKLQSEGTLRYGGIMLEHPVTSETPPPLPFKGSVFVLMLESRDRVMQLLMDDPYAHNNVWDWTAAVISPFKSAIAPPS